MITTSKTKKIEMGNAVGYCRYSSDNQREESITAQIRAIENFCKQYNHNLIRVYSDEAISGTSTNDREKFKEMISDSKDKSFEYVIVHKLDRFSRNRYDSAVAKKLLKDNGVKVLSVLENLSDSPESVMLESILEGMNEYYSLNLAREVKKGLFENAHNCLHNGGTPPLGYDIDEDQKYVVNTKESIIVKEIFNLYSSGYGYSQIAIHLNQQGLKNKLGRPFSKTSIRDHLLNEKYIGIYTYGKKDVHGKLTHKGLKIDNGVPSIIDKETFYIIAERMHKRQTGTRLSAKTPYLLAGLCECGICGSIYAAGYRTRNRDRSIHYGYLCSGRKSKKTQCTCKPIRRELFEKKIIDIIKNKIFNNEQIEIIANEIYLFMKELEVNQDFIINGVDIEIKNMQGKLEALLDLYLDGKINKDVFENKQLLLEKELNSKQIKRIDILSSKNNVNKNNIFDYVRKLSQDLESKDSEILRKVLNLFIEKIIVNNYEIKIKYNFIPLNSLKDEKFANKLSGNAIITIKR